MSKEATKPKKTKKKKKKKTTCDSTFGLTEEIIHSDHPMYRRQIEKKNDDDYDDDNDDKRKYNDIPEKSNQIFR